LRGVWLGYFATIDDSWHWRLTRFNSRQLRMKALVFAWIGEVTDAESRN
jgi:hypothetical protein